MYLNKLRIILTALIITVIPLTACGDVQKAEAEDSTVTNVYLDELFNEAMTDADKQRQYLVYLEQYLKEDILEAQPEIEEANVALVSNAESDFLINSENDAEEIQVNVVLKLEDELTSISASKLADVLATAIGNATTDNIFIQDSEGTTLFPDGTN